MINSLRSKLLLTFCSIVTIMYALSMYNILFARRYSEETKDLFGQLSATTVISVKLTDSFQNLSNLINYKNQELLPLVERSNEDLVAFTKKSDPLIKKSAELAGDPNIFYKYMEIQKHIYTYKEKSSVIAAMSKYEKSRIILYDNLYELKELKTKINEELSGLLIRQTVAVDSLYSFYARKIDNQILFSVVITLIITAIVLLFSIKTTRNISRPVEALAQRALRAENGDFKPAPRPPRSYPEVDYLVDAMDSMINRIGFLITEIEDKAALEKKLSEEEIKILTVDNLLRSAELRILQGQINPHFLFNTINIIVTLARIENADSTASLLDDMALILRYGLRTVQKTASVREELTIVETYLRIQKARFGARIKTGINVADDCLEVPIPTMILQPIVENAMNHGLEPKMGIVHLDIEVTMVEPEKRGPMLQVRIADDGIGIESGMLLQLKECIDLACGPERTRTGTDGDHGIPNVIRRLGLLYDCPEIEIDSISGHGTTFLIRIPAVPEAGRSDTRLAEIPSPS